MTEREAPLRYFCIDLKSFYASVECVERQMDPLTTDLVVADPSRGDGTICLAVSPHLKSLGVRNRCRVFEIPKNLKYIKAVPRMHLYIDYSARIYGIYLRYLAPEDIHVYSVDEAFFDGAPYASLYGPDIRSLTRAIQEDVKATTGITSTCGMGTNLYLAKVAMDMVAKHSPDFRAVFDEESYCRELGDHRPLRDFWMIGRGTERRLNGVGIYTMADIRRTDPSVLYRLLGRNADYLIDHAWGREPTTMADIKSYRSPAHSLSSNQVLLRDYTREEALIVLKEMIDLLTLDLTDQELVTDAVTLYVGYAEDFSGGLKSYTREQGLAAAEKTGDVRPDDRTESGWHPLAGSPDGTGKAQSFENTSFRPWESYVQLTGHYASGSAVLPAATDSRRLLTEVLTGIYRERVVPGIFIRRVGISFENVRPASLVQLSLFLDRETAEKDHELQGDVNELRDRFGKNAVLKGMDLLPCGTTIERNGQIGGHKA